MTTQNASTEDLPGRVVAAPPCTCLLSDPESVSYVAYAVGPAEAERMVSEDRAGCPAHGRPLR